MNQLVCTLLLLLATVEASAIDIEQYQRHSSVQWVWAVMALDALPIKGNEAILDVGCGDGKVTALLAQKVPEGSVIGVDLSVDLAKAHFTHPNLTFQVADATQLPYQEQFDIVTSFLCLNWLAEPQALFDGIYRALKPGGVALLTIPAPLRDKSWGQKWLDIISSDKFKPYLTLFENRSRTLTQAHIEFFATRAGLHVKAISNVKTAHVFHDKEEVKIGF